MDLAALLHAKHWEQFIHFEHVGLYSLVVYDWILCFPNELALDLSAGRNPATLTYLFARYWPLATSPIVLWVRVFDHTRQECARTFKLPMLLEAGNFASAAMVIATRVYAFTGRNRSIAVLLAACLVVVGVYQLWVGATQIKLSSTGCYPINVGKAEHLSGFFLAPLLFDFIAMLVLLIYSFASFPLRLMWNSSTVAKVFIRDGAMYFVAILAIHAFNAGMSFQPDDVISGTGVALSMFLPPVLACRMVLNLREAGGTHEELPSHELTSLTAIDPESERTNWSTGSDNHWLHRMTPERDGRDENCNV